MDNLAQDDGCNRYRVRDNARGGGRQTLFDTGGGIGFRADVGTVVPVRVGPGKKRAHSFLIGHDLYLWSPKGWFTGSSNTAGSVLVGTHFERVDMSCTNGALCSGINSGDFRRIRVLLREWDLWSYIRPRVSTGLNVLWYDASNLRNERNQPAHNLGICSSSKIASGDCRNGIGGDWVDVFLNWRYQF